MKRLSYGYRDEPCHLPSRGTIAARRACSSLAVCADKPGRLRARAFSSHYGVTLIAEMQFADDDDTSLVGDDLTRSNNA